MSAMETLDLDAWNNFSVATVGASAALAGLIIVAVSVNVKEIIAGSSLPARAGATIAAVVLILVTSTVLLVPDQPALFLGLEIVVFAIIALLLQLDASRRMLGSPEGAPRAVKLGNSAVCVAQLLIVVAGGVLIALGSPAGLGFVAFGFVMIFIVSTVNAWVLMVEILR